MFVSVQGTSRALHSPQTFFKSFKWNIRNSWLLGLLHILAPSHPAGDCRSTWPMDRTSAYRFPWIPHPWKTKSSSPKKTPSPLTFFVFLKASTSSIKKSLGKLSQTQVPPKDCILRDKTLPQHLLQFSAPTVSLKVHGDCHSQVQWLST